MQKSFQYNLNSKNYLNLNLSNITDFAAIDHTKKKMAIGTITDLVIYLIFFSLAHDKCKKCE